jgi:hypothetical protein
MWWKFSSCLRWCLAVTACGVVFGVPRAAGEATGTTGGNHAGAAAGASKHRIRLSLDREPVVSSFYWCGAWLLAGGTEISGGNAHGTSEAAAQVLVLQPAGELAFDLPPGRSVTCELLSCPSRSSPAGLQFWVEPLQSLSGDKFPLPECVLKLVPVDRGVAAEDSQLSNETGEPLWRLEGDVPGRTEIQLPLHLEATSPNSLLFQFRAKDRHAAVRIGGIRFLGETLSEWEVEPGPMQETFPPPNLPSYQPAIEWALVEWDWRLQDGIGTPREPASYEEVLPELCSRIERMLLFWRAQGLEVAQPLRQLQVFVERIQALAQSALAPEEEWRQLWRQFHGWRRRLLLENLPSPLRQIAFVKHIPSAFSHQLTQYYGRDARPGGGIYLLKRPGYSMRVESLTEGRFPLGSYQHLDVSPDGSRLAFAFCEVDRPPPSRDAHGYRFFHLFEIGIDGQGLRRLTSGDFDDFSPRYLGENQMIFISTRRGGFHRCGRGPCPVYTLSLLESDGTVRVVSYHETHEWDPVVLPDGRILYTRWDYVDRHAVFYQQLWTVRPDGSDVRIFYGNGTFNPVGIWEAMPVPGSRRVMATAAAHHAMTAGSIILVDVRKGQDGPQAIERLTPDAPFPESEVPVVREPGGAWFNPVGVNPMRKVPREAQRWPGHCYRSPFPLSEKFFLAAYSFDPLIGEPTANRANMFALYLVDAYGNKELLYRDLNHSSLWPRIVQPRPMPGLVKLGKTDHALSGAEISSDVQNGTHPPDGRSARVVALSEGGVVDGAISPRIEKLRFNAVGNLPEVPGPNGVGLFIVQNVYAAWPSLPDVPIKRLRIVQVLPKSTPHINTPPVGLANASPGKQVLGTVPVEPDGSAYFWAPAGIPLSFQALDELGQAVQIMRSVTYLQPGEVSSCIGCHEPRHLAPFPGAMPLALRRPPSQIQPGPRGSRPLSYPLLVQPILDRHCLACHNDTRAEGGVNLVGRSQGHYSVSYLALTPRVKISAWDGRAGFCQTNSEPYTQPDFFGARGSTLMKLLLSGHGEVELSGEEIEALATWMDTNALFYGTFDPEDQARQQRGEEISGPAWE